MSLKIWIKGAIDQKKAMRKLRGVNYELRQENDRLAAKYKAAQLRSVQLWQEAAALRKALEDIS